SRRHWRTGWTRRAAVRARRRRTRGSVRGRWSPRRQRALQRPTCPRSYSPTTVDISYDATGLVPVIVQDWNTGEVLTLAYANEQAVARTRETGELHLWSRSRDELWHKGATSGNTQAVKALRLDCDGDALVALV